MTRQVAIVPHTHWDREWYSPFQTFRLRLVDLLDEFLPQLEGDLSYARFLLDGQMAVVDDYLAVRPEAEDRLRRLAATGRVAMGPWYTLPDEFLVSGETHIRNLQLGLARAGAFGGAMDVGYLPDMFGHVAQMPQILRLAGFEHAVVWRGVPAAIDKSAFWWSAPDGSTVRAEYLRHGYGNGAGIPDDAKALIRRIAAYDAEVASFRIDGILFMNGTDHQVPQPWLGRVVAEANELQDDYHLEVTSLAEYLADAPVDGLPAWRGELRSSARANLLMGVASNRVDVKQAAARAERALEQLAEPLSALFRPAGDWPRALLAAAWHEVIRNAAHDSICACSHDEVVNAVIHRYAEARQIAEGLTNRALGALGGSMSVEGNVVVNPSAHPRGAVVEVVVPHGDPVPGGQVTYRRTPGTTAGRELSASGLASYLGSIRGQRLGEHTYVTGIDVADAEAADTDGSVGVTLRTSHKPLPTASIEAARRELYEVIASRPDARFVVRLDRPALQKVLVRIDGVPGYGWSTWDVEEAAGSAVEPVVVDGTTMRNGAVTVEVDASDGTFSLNGVDGFNRLVDDGDEGDTYNYSPPDHDAVIDAPDDTSVTVVESGPMRARLQIDRTYTWPAHVDATSHRAGSVSTVVTTVLELRAGDDMVRIVTAFDNRARDHRLRTWFPLPQPAESSRAECAFAVVERGLEAEGGPGEYGLATFPSRRFVSAGGLTVLHEGLLEYELVDDGGAVALTLLRANAMLSRPPMTYRPEPAGPNIVLDGPQMQGQVIVQCAVHIGDRDPYELVDDAFLPMPVVSAHGGGDRSARGTELVVEGARVSAVQRAGNDLEVRVFNPSPTPTMVGFGDRSGWLVDLRGRPLEPFDGTFELRPWGIATARLGRPGGT